MPSVNLPLDAASQVNMGACGCCAVTTECCPSDPVPQILHITVNNVLDCACADGSTGTVAYNPSTSKWEGSISLSGCSSTLNLFLSCVGPAPFTWQLDTTGCVTITFSLVVLDSCNPFQVTATETIGGGCCSGAVSGQVEVVFTE